MRPSARPVRRRRLYRAKGSSRASRMVAASRCLLKGWASVAVVIGVVAAAVSRVTVMGVVVPRRATGGAMVQVELAGAPVQLRATLPERLARELSCRG